MRVRDLIEQEIDIDVVDDVCEELYTAMCGPVKLTGAGETEFADVLEYGVNLVNNGGDIVAIINVDGDSWKKRLRRAKKFFESAGGYCTVDEYNKWFEDTIVE